MIDAATVLKNASSLPTLPDSVCKLSSMISDSRSSATDFERVIKPDPALTANLLRFANSPYFGLGRQVSSVRHAVMILGMKRLFEVAASAAFNGVIPQTLAGFEIDAAGFWRHCIAVAVMSERLTVELKIKTPELTFTAGLLHDVGKLAISSYLAREFQTVAAQLRKEESDFISVERETLGTDHCEVGGALVESWNLPEPIAWAARWHHATGEGLDEEKRALVDLVHIADCLAHSMGFGHDVGELSRKPNDSVIERLGIKVQKLERVACESIEQISEMEHMG